MFKFICISWANTGGQKCARNLLRPPQHTHLAEKTHVPTQGLHELFSWFKWYLYLPQERRIFFPQNVSVVKKKLKMLVPLNPAVSFPLILGLKQIALTKTLKTETINTVRKGRNKDCPDILTQAAKKKKR